MENQEIITIEPEVQKTAPQKEKPRRIGTITMGFALIIVGVTILISMFNPSFDMVLVAKLSPLILIALGLEIVISTFIFKGEKLKYDFWSGVVCFLLILTSIGLAIVPKLYEDYAQYYGPERNALHIRLIAELEDNAYMVLKNYSEISDVDATCSVTSTEFDSNMTVRDLKSEDYVSFHISLDSSFGSKKEFAESCEKIIKALSTLNAPVDHIGITTDVKGGDFWYSLDCDGKFAMNATAEKLERSVEFVDYTDKAIETFDNGYTDGTAVVDAEPNPEYNDGIDMAPLNPDGPDFPDVTIAVPSAPEAPEAPVVTGNHTAAPPAETTSFVPHYDENGNYIE